MSQMLLILMLMLLILRLIMLIVYAFDPSSILC